jgi:4'-phosphopantetheinyl transferase
MGAPHIAVLDRGTATPSGDFLRFLKQEEVQRYRSFARRERAAQFLWSRLAIRTMLARMLGRPSVAVELVERAPYPPAVRGAEDLHLSVAHSGRWVLCAVARTPVGVDIEDTLIERDTAALAEAGLPEDQRAWVRSHRDSTRAFYEMWTFNESVVKLAATPAPTLAFTADSNPRLLAPGGEQWLCRQHGGYVMTAIARHAGSSRIERLSTREIETSLT